MATTVPLYPTTSCNCPRPRNRALGLFTPDTMSRGGHRESLTPMDFEYDNKQGPVDVRSPFLAFTNSPAARKRELDSTAPSPVRGQGTHQPSKAPLYGQPGPQSQFGSPTKNAFATPNRLRETAFNLAQSGGKPIPSLPQHIHNAWTPRTPAADYDFSSGGETPNTPAQDSEQATPDTQMAGKMRLLMDSPSPKKTGRRQSFFRALKNLGSPSPAKESIKHIEMEVSRKHYNEKMENRVAKRRSTRERSDRSNKKRMVLRDNQDDESDSEPAQVQKKAPTEPAKGQQTYGANIAGFFHWIEAHPGLPSVLSWYMQFTVNVFLAVSFMYIMYLIYCGVSADIDIESNKHMSEMMVEIAHCAKNYRENRCEPDTRVPAMEMACGNWETCMSRDPKKLAQASVTVKTFARIINSFFEEFSYKSMVCSHLNPRHPLNCRPLNCHPLNCHLLSRHPLNCHPASLTWTPRNRSSSPSSSSAASTSPTGPSVCSASSTLSLNNSSITTSYHHRRHLIVSTRTATLRTVSNCGRLHIRRPTKREASCNLRSRPCCSIHRVHRPCRVMRRKGVEKS